MATIKLIILAVIFVGTSGAVFSDYFKKHRLLSFMAALVAIVASYYLIEDIYNDIKKETDGRNKQLANKIDKLENEINENKSKNNLTFSELEEIKKPLRQPEEKTLANKNIVVPRPHKNNIVTPNTKNNGNFPKNGWVYIGYISNNKWNTKYFDDITNSKTMIPNSGDRLRATGLVNIRKNHIFKPGYERIIGVVKTGQELTIAKIKNVTGGKNRVSGYYWFRYK